MAKSINDIRKERTAGITNLDKQQKQRERNKSQSFYQSSEWRKVREEYRKVTRRKQEKEIIKIYEQNIDKNTPDELIKFMMDERKLPSSEKSLQKGIIKAKANHCDHIKPIAEGGKKLDHNNLQWLTQSQHSKKTLEENPHITKRIYFG